MTTTSAPVTTFHLSTDVPAGLAVARRTVAEIVTLVSRRLDVRTSERMLGIADDAPGATVFAPVRVVIDTRGARPAGLPYLESFGPAAGVELVVRGES